MKDYEVIFNQNIISNEIVTRNEIDNSNDKNIYDKKLHFTNSLETRNYKNQFSLIYQNRFKVLKDKILKNSNHKWENKDFNFNNHDVKYEDKILNIKSNVMCWVIGLINSNCKYKLNILSDVENGIDDITPLAPVSYVDNDNDNDNYKIELTIEDMSGKIKLDTELKPDLLLVTGCVVGVLGIEYESAKFKVLDIKYPAISPQRHLKPRVPFTNGKKIALISGLNFCEDQSIFKFELFKQYLSGEIGLDIDKEYVKNISQLIIAGNSFNPVLKSDLIEQNKSKLLYITTNNYGSKNFLKINPSTLKKFQNFLNEVLFILPVYIMPGNNDPSEQNFPQLPIHKSLFKVDPILKEKNRFNLMTNPQWIEISNFQNEKIRLLGTSGQNIDDIFKYIKGSKSLNQEQHKHKTIDLMKENIKWQNIAPSAPDSLYSYSYSDFDPFVFTDEIPHVYFVGNQKYFSSEFFCYDPENSENKILFISIPSFSDTNEFVIVNLDDFHIDLIKICS